MKFLTKFFFFFFFLLCCGLIFPLTANNSSINNQHLSINNQHLFILDKNPYNFKWFNKIFHAWEVKNFANMNNIGLQDAFIILDTLKDKDLYLTSLTKLVFHINRAFHNNPLFKNFNSSNSLSYNLFTFFSYIHTLEQTNREESDNLLKSEFNLYEIVSIKRLAEQNLAIDLANTKKTIADYNFTDSTLDELANEYESLNIQDLVFSKKGHDENNSYIFCLGKVTNLPLIKHINYCNELYPNKENNLIGIRECYLKNIQKLKDVGNQNLEDNILTLHTECAPLVNNYLHTYNNNEFLQKYLIFLICSYSQKLKQN